MEYGDKGEQVARIQAELKKQGYYTAAIDGKFGPKTEAAVKAFQEDNKLKKDGIVGPKTTAALYGTSTSTTTNNNNGSSGGSSKPKVTPTPKLTVKPTVTPQKPTDNPITNNDNKGGSSSQGANADGTVYALVSTDSTRLTDKQQTENAEYIYDYLFDEGWTTEAICGVLGNIEVESHFNPGVWQVIKFETDNTIYNTSYGYGIVQWDDGAKFLSWAGLTVEKANQIAKNDPKKLMDLELEYLIYSSQPVAPIEDRQWYATTKYYSPYKMTYKEYIASTKDVGDLALVFHGSYERSADDGSGEVDRSTYAEEWYKYFSKK